MGSRLVDPLATLKSLARDGHSLALSNGDLCFLAALFLRGDGAALASFSEEALLVAFDDVANLVMPATDAKKLRFTNTVRRLREQKLLTRVDGVGIFRSGDYALTRLAVAIIEFYLREESLTRESLTLLSRTLINHLTAIHEAAARGAANAEDAEHFRLTVASPLRITIGELARGIERRQRGFDVEQQDYQRKVGELLSASWFGALEQCQSLLDSTSATLRELSQVLLHDTQEMQTLLLDILEHVSAAHATEAEETTRAVMDTIDRIAAWGAERQRAWSDYYQYVHRFLRDVVRLDPMRTLTARVREAISNPQRYALVTVAAPAIRVLRTTAPAGDPPPVERPKKERDKPLEQQAPNDPDAAMKSAIADAFADGQRNLGDITRFVLAQLADEIPEAGHFAAVGRIAELLAAGRALGARAPRPWVQGVDTFELEDWHVL